MRIIDADALKRNLCTTKCGSDSKLCVGKPDSCFQQYRMDMLTLTIDEQPTIKQPQWISCAERLPTEEGMYRVCHKSKLIADRYFYGDADLFTKFGKDPITHWKPIEEPPKGDE